MLYSKITWRRYRELTGTDVALILSGMNGNSLASGLNAGASGPDNARLVPPPSGVTQSGDPVDVDTEVNNVRAPSVFVRVG